MKTGRICMTKNIEKNTSSYKNRHDQQAIHDSRDSKYFANKNHPEHNNWVKQQRHDNDQGNRHERDDKHGQGNKQNDGNRHDQVEDKHDKRQ